MDNQDIVVYQTVLTVRLNRGGTKAMLSKAENVRVSRGTTRNNVFEFCVKKLLESYNIEPSQSMLVLFWYCEKNDLD